MNLFSSDKRLPGFTLVELMAGMVASGIVIACVWSAGYIINKQFTQSYNSKKRSENLSFFYRCLHNDFYRTAEVKQFDNRLSMIGQNERVEYYFHENYSLRKSEGIVDTFWTAANTAMTEGTDTLRNSVVLEVISETGSKIIMLNKLRSATDRMKSDD